MRSLLRKRVLRSSVAAVAVTAFGYCIDSDPPYPNVWDTVKEFLILCFVILFPVFLGLFWLFRRRVS